MTAPVSVYEFLYPKREDGMRLRVELTDVRAANDIIIHYDFDRDGWSIESPTIFMWESEGPTPEGLEEVAFIPAFSERAEANLDDG